MVNNDKFIRKQVVFNRESQWHMKIYKRMMKESENFSGYAMGIFKWYFESHSTLEDDEMVNKEKLEPKVKIDDFVNAPKIVINGKSINTNKVPAKKNTSSEC